MSLDFESCAHDMAWQQSCSLYYGRRSLPVCTADACVNDDLWLNARQTTGQKVDHPIGRES
jgi:hypothetical protein